MAKYKKPVFVEPAKLSKKARKEYYSGLREVSPKPTGTITHKSERYDVRLQRHLAKEYYGKMTR